MTMKKTGLTRKQDSVPEAAACRGRKDAWRENLAVYFRPILHREAKRNEDKANLAVGLKIAYLA